MMTKVFASVLSPFGVAKGVNVSLGAFDSLGEKGSYERLKQAVKKRENYLWWLVLPTGPLEGGREFQVSKRM